MFNTSVGMLLNSSTANCSAPLHFLKILFVVLTAFSAFPFPCGWYGLDDVCLMSRFLVNYFNSDLNCKPLSLTISWGIPCIANIFSNIFMIPLQFVLSTFSTDKKLE